MRALFELLGETHELSQSRRKDGVDLHIGDRTYAVAMRDLGDGQQIVTVDGRDHRIAIANQGDQIFVHAGGAAWTVLAVDELAAASGSGHGADQVAAPMPGTVISVSVEAGASIAAGETILTIESMKLETAITAPRDGTVAEIPFPTGATFDKGAILVRFEALADD